MTTSKITPFNSNLSAGRQRYLALGRHYADAIRQIRERGLEAALEAADAMGGATQRMSIARSLVKAVKNAGNVPAYRFHDRMCRRLTDSAVLTERTVRVPMLSWKFSGRRQVGVVEFLPMFSGPARGNPAPIARPIP